MLVWFFVIISFDLLDSTCPEPRLVVQVFAQALLPCQLLLAFGKRNANCTTRRCTSMCAASQCTCLAVPAALSRKAQSAYASKWGQDYCNMIFLNMYHVNCTLLCVHFIALSHEAKSEWNRTQKSCKILWRKGHLHRCYKWSGKVHARQPNSPSRDRILLARTVLWKFGDAQSF